MRNARVVLGLVSAAIASSLAVTPASAAAGIPGPLGLSTVQGLEAFAGYRTTSDDRDASAIITLPAEGTCDEFELTFARSFMGLQSESSYVSGVVGAFCQVGIPQAYMAGVETAESEIVGLDGVGAGDRIKIKITDNGTTTTVKVRNLTGGGSISASTASVPDNYEVGIQVAGGPAHLVDHLLRFSKNRVDGAALKAADPTRVTFSNPETPTFTPSRLRNDTYFNVRST